MKHSLYYKFILGYLIFGLLGFVTIAVASSRLMYRHLLEEKTENMYDEANLIASSYSSIYQGKRQELNTVYPQLQMMASFLKTEIWVVNRQGIIVVDSNQSARSGTMIKEFDPTDTGNRYYRIGNYYGQFPYDVVSLS